jgi:hypothetical protein
MKRFFTIATVVLLTASLAAAPAVAGKPYSKVKGQVVQVEQHVRTQNGGEFDRLTIRTRNGEQLHLSLGQGGACDGCFQAGDMVRARVHAAAGPDGAPAVQWMRVQRNGEMVGYTNSGGRMVRDTGRGLQAGGGDQIRDRVHRPDAGAAGGGGRGRSGGGRSGGGGGG